VTLRLNAKTWIQCTALAVSALALQAESCGTSPNALPEQFEEQLISGNPALLCPKWQGILTDFYFTKLQCDVTDEHLLINADKTADFYGHKFHPVWVNASSGGMSLEKTLAGLVGAETLFSGNDGPTVTRDIVKGDFIKLFNQAPLIYEVDSPPPLALVAADIYIGQAITEHRKQLAALGPPKLIEPGSKKAQTLFELNHAGPIQKAVAPIARVFREKCAKHILEPALIANLAANPRCERALGTDLFIKALFGEDRVGQAIALHKQAATISKEAKDKKIQDLVNKIEAEQKAKSSGKKAAPAK